jgi:hypothetical protein
MAHGLRRSKTVGLRTKIWIQDKTNRRAVAGMGCETWRVFEKRGVVGNIWIQEGAGNTKVEEKCAMRRAS